MRGFEHSIYGILRRVTEIRFIIRVNAFQFGVDYFLQVFLLRFLK